ncbi:MAG: two-component system sensor histidine kinase NtrB [Blastocatellia bacterium]
MVSEETLKNKLGRLILVRMTAMLLLLVSLLAIDHLWPAPGNLMSRLRLIIFATFGLTLLYALLAHYWKAHTIQAWMQVTGDVLLVTGLVFQTRMMESPFTALYLVVIFIASSLLSRPGAFVLTGFTCLLYGAMNYAAFQHWWPFTGGNAMDGVAAHTLGAAVGFNFFAFFAVAFLGSQLHERLSRTDENLAQVNRNLDDLRAFSERVIASISSGLMTLDLTHHIISFNRAAEEITGYTAQEVVGQPLRMLIPDAIELFQSHGHDAHHASHLSRLTVGCRTKSGKVIEIGLSASPMTSTTGEVTGFVLPFQDLTEVMELEREIRMQDRLAALGRVAAAIAHEIRNPLASMRGAVQVLGSEIALSDEQAQLMNIVLRESDRLDRIISDFLTYARPRRPEPSLMDLNEVLDETLTLLGFSTEVDRERHRLRAMPAPQPALVYADAGQIRQVFWNLARNAVSAMPDGGSLLIEIHCLARGSSEAEQLEVVFRDTGVGMSDEQMERVFEPFSSFSSGGTGLGMSIVYQILHEHQGRIFIRSRPGEGTDISFRLTAARREMSACAAA